MGIDQRTTVCPVSDAVPAQMPLLFKQSEVRCRIDRLVNTVHLAGHVDWVIFEIHAFIQMGRGIATDHDFHPANRLTNLLALVFWCCRGPIKPVDHATPLGGSNTDYLANLAGKSVAHR